MCRWLGCVESVQSIDDPIRLEGKLRGSVHLSCDAFLCPVSRNYIQNVNIRQCELQVGGGGPISSFSILNVFNVHEQLVGRSDEK